MNLSYPICGYELEKTTDLYGFLQSKPHMKQHCQQNAVSSTAKNEGSWQHLLELLTAVNTLYKGDSRMTVISCQQQSMHTHAHTHTYTQLYTLPKSLTAV
jgi:hypothetical protein